MGPEVTSMTTTTHGARLRYAVATLLVLVAAAGVLLWRGTAGTGVTASLEAASHGTAQGLTLSALPDPWFVYTENGDDVTSVTVTAPDGSTLPVRLVSHAFTYGPHRQGRLVGRFEVPAGAGLVDLRVVVSPAQGQVAVPVAVTTFDVVPFERLVLWGGAALLAVNVAGALVLVVGPRRRERVR
jgi:hypothetical protein